MHSRTRRFCILSWLFSILSFTAYLGPTIYFIASAYASSALVVEKITLSCTIIAVVILSLISIVNKTVLRSKIWIILIGLYFILDTLILPVFLIGAGQILDELIFAPVKKHYKNLYLVNKEIDRRG